MLNNFNIKKVILQDVIDGKINGCRKCKFDKICQYCGLDWTGIHKHDIPKIKKQDPFESFNKKIDEIVTNEEQKKLLKVELKILTSKFK